MISIVSATTHRPRFGMRGVILAACVFAFGVACAHAKGIDLSKPLGDKYGCINKDGQEVAADEMLLITKDELITAASACTIMETSPQADGSLVLKTMCESEGEESPDPTLFTLKRAAKPAGVIVVTDSDGAVFGKVSPCP